MNDTQIYKGFAAQLCAWTVSGKLPSLGNQDIRYALQLQKARLDKFQVRIKYKLKLSEEKLDCVSKIVYSNTTYINQLIWRSYYKTANYYIKGRKRFSLIDIEHLHLLIVSLDPEQVQEMCCCPNCGTISEIKTLTQGCPDCGTKFLITDLFPKVSNFHFVRDYATDIEQAKDRTIKGMLIGALVGSLLVSPDVASRLMQSAEGGFSWGWRILLILWPYVAVGGLGAAVGHVIQSVIIGAKMMQDNLLHAPIADREMEARKNLTEFMREHEPGFSYEYFTSRVQALARILIFTDDRSNLAVYEGEMEQNDFDHIIDVQFGGAISFNQGIADGGYCYLDLNIYMINTYCQDHRVKQKTEEFQMKLCKCIKRSSNCGFSIKKVSCKSCGASFDASRDRHCPYCRSCYKLREDDWVITYIRKI